MIIGECPYCDAVMWNQCADVTPAFEKVVCSECRETVWLYHSKLDPIAYTEEDFFDKFLVDEDTKIIKEKPVEAKE